jgi:hypothetical protein
MIIDENNNERDRDLVSSSPLRGNTMLIAQIPFLVVSLNVILLDFIHGIPKSLNIYQVTFLLAVIKP